MTDKSNEPTGIEPERGCRWGGFTDDADTEGHRAAANAGTALSDQGREDEVPCPNPAGPDGYCDAHRPSDVGR